MLPNYFMIQTKKIIERVYASNIFFRLVGIFIFISVWFILANLNDSLKTYVASPVETLIALFSLLRSRVIVLDVATTAIRTIESFIPAVFLGVLAGIALGLSKKLFYSGEIMIEFFRSLPSTAILPIFILVFGINDFSRVGTAFFISFWIVLINTMYGIKNMEKSRVNVAISMGANKFQIFKEVIFWEIIPYIFSAMRLAISISLVIILITEMIIGSKYGLGVRLFEFQQTFKVGYLYAEIIIIGFMGLAINKLILLMQNKLSYRD